jgi:hypothetical protein
MSFQAKGPESLTVRVDVRWPPEEKKRLKEIAEAAGVSMSDLVRNRALGRPVVPKTDAAMLREFRRLGALLKHVHNETGGVFRQQTYETIMALQAAAKAVAEADVAASGR